VAGRTMLEFNAENVRKLKLPKSPVGRRLVGRAPGPVLAVDPHLMRLVSIEAAPSVQGADGACNQGEKHIRKAEKP
jgi:hypothetical protein